MAEDWRQSIDRNKDIFALNVIITKQGKAEDRAWYHSNVMKHCSKKDNDYAFETSPMFHVPHLNFERTHVTSTSAAVVVDGIGTHNQPDLRTTPFMGRAVYGDLVKPGPPLKEGSKFSFYFTLLKSL